MKHFIFFSKVLMLNVLPLALLVMSFAMQSNELFLAGFIYTCIAGMIVIITK